MNTIDNDNLNKSTSGSDKPKKITIQQKLASEALLTGIIDESFLPNPRTMKKSSKVSVDTDKDTLQLFDDFLEKYDADDKYTALRISNILFYVHGEKKLKQILTKENFYRFLIFRIEILIDAEQFSQIPETINVASMYENDMEQSDKDMIPHFIWLKTKFYLYEKKYISAVNSVDALIKSRKRPIEDGIYESLILAKAEALCGLERYNEGLALIEKEFPEVSQQDVFDIQRWKAEAFLHLHKYEELESCLAIMKKIEPNNIIIGNFSRLLASEN